MKHRYNPTREYLERVFAYIAILFTFFIIIALGKYKISSLQEQLDSRQISANVVLTLNTEWNGYLTETAQVPKPTSSVTVKNKIASIYMFDGHQLVRTELEMSPGMEVPVYVPSFYITTQEVYEVVTTAYVPYYILVEDVMQ